MKKIFRRRFFFAQNTFRRAESTTAKIYKIFGKVAAEWEKGRLKKKFS
ncbi:MAG: hypothetical protein IK062_05290 [Selenomonadaceae bacterium]|nr:hypothetical protein [Selenomonadaceae bacterium]